MNAQPANLLSQIDDIKGLDHVSLWPLAPGWWGLLGLLMLSTAAGLIISRRHRAKALRWQVDARRALEALETRLDGRTAKDVAAELSALLRRIAMQRFSRAECAGLEGGAWLDWLKAHDPQGFDWTGSGKILTEAPYAPPGLALPSEKIRTLIAATRSWVA